jgi:hypothetical protein
MTVGRALPCWMRVVTEKNNDLKKTVDLSIFVVIYSLHLSADRFILRA